MAINNTVYANGLGGDTNVDGLRIEGVIPARKMTVLNNVIAENVGIGLNLKEVSASAFVGQWNLNTDGYNTLDVARGTLDLDRVPPLLVLPPGTDATGPDDFHLSVESQAIDASAISAKKLQLNGSTTLSDGQLDETRADLGFHFDNKTDFVSGFRKPLTRRIRILRKQATRCEKHADKAVKQLLRGRGPCLTKRAKARLTRKCGPSINAICQ